MKKEIRNENEYNGTDGSYVVKKNKKLNIIAFVGCLILSVIIWVYVMNVENSDYTKTFSLNVELTGEAELFEGRGLTVYGLPDTLVNVTVQGTKADIQKYAEKDYRAYIDVSKLKEKGSYPITVSVETPSSSVTVTSTDPLTTTVYVDVEVEKKVSITAVSSDKSDTGDKAVLSSSLNEIILKGAKTYVDKVVRAEAVVNTADISDGATLVPVEIRLYGEMYGGKELQLSSLYITVTADGLHVSVQVPETVEE